MHSFKTTIAITLIAAAFGAGFFLGRSTVPTPAPLNDDTTPPEVEQPRELVSSDAPPPQIESQVLEEETIDFSNPEVELRNTDGLRIQAELLALSGQLLTIRRKDGQEFSFNVEMLIEKDRYYVFQHFAGKPPATDDTLGVNREYIIPDSEEYLETLFEEILKRD